MSRVVEVILHLRGGAAYALVFLVPALEASAFVGFLFPGELAVLLGGVLAYQGRIALPWAAAAAIGGSIVGDSVGYAVGARWGEVLFRTRIVRRFVTPERRRRAEALLRRGGGTAILVGRFTAVARVLVPGLSGMARVRYRRFLVANTAGGVAWAGSFTLLGYLAGDAWHTVQRIAARASLLLAILLVILAGLAIAARRIAANGDRFRAWWQGVLRRPKVARLRQRYAAQIDFLYRRLDPRGALGLYLTVGLLLSAAAGWIFGLAVEGILANNDLVLADAPLARFVAAHRSIRFTRALESLRALGSPAAVVLLVAVAALALVRLARSLRPAGFLVACVAGGELLRVVVGVLVGRPAPAGGLIPAPGFSFPSGHTVVAATLGGAVAFALSVRPTSWAARVWAWAAAAMLVLAVGLCAVYLAIAHPSDVVGGAALGGAWLAVCATGWRTWERLSRSRALRATGSRVSI